MHKIGVIADSHNLMPDEMPILLKDVDEIWHLGDVCTPRTLDILHALPQPLQVIRGNNDFHPWPLTLNLSRGGFRFHLVHIPPRHGLGIEADFILHGHTHIPRDETLDNIRYLNPGTVSRPTRGAPPSYGILTLSKSKVDWKIRRLA